MKTFNPRRIFRDVSVFLLAIVALAGLPSSVVAQTSALRPEPCADGPLLVPSVGVEPNAGSWKTWVLTPGSEMRLPPPPGRAETASEIRDLRAMVSQRDDVVMDRIRFWNAGTPSYRWVELALNQIVSKPLSNPRNARTLALLNVAIYDATIAAWDTKYFYNRPRPSRFLGSVVTAISDPASPSYPSEHAVVAGAAAAILSFVYPDDAQTFADRAQEAANSRLLAGVQYLSDVQAGLDLGRAVAAKVIEHAKADGSDAKWTGTVPKGPGFWNGTNPIEPLAGTWKPWVLTSGDQLRPGPPPAFDSEQKLAELAEIKNLPRTFTTNERALYWQTLYGAFVDWYNIAGKRIFESQLEIHYRSDIETGLAVGRAAAQLVIGRVKQDGSE